MENIEMPTLEELQEMAAVDIRTVDKNTLVDLDDVEIHTELPLEEKDCGLYPSGEKSILPYLKWNDCKDQFRQGKIRWRNV